MDICDVNKKDEEIQKHERGWKKIKKEKKVEGERKQIIYTMTNNNNNNNIREIIYIITQ